MKFQKIGIIGVGRFGGMAYRQLREKLSLRVYDPDPSKLVGLPEAASFEETVTCDLVILCVPISVLKQVCERMAPHLVEGQTVVDTCSVKSRPVEWMLEALPEGVNILGTHPLFGPDSGKDGIAGLKIALCPARIAPDSYREIWDFLLSLDLVLVDTTPEEHDRQIAVSQAVFHLIAQAMKRLDWGAKPISTPGPDTFYRLVKTVQKDTDQLFHDMEKENPYAKEYRRQFIREIIELDKELDLIKVEGSGTE